MEPLGLGSLPDDPQEMPTEEIARDLGLHLGGSKDGEEPIDPDYAVASEREIEVAVAEVECGDESGYTEARYAAEWELQEALVEQERTMLERIRENVEARRADVMRIVAENAPAAE
jgi:hypothetical protein